MRDWRGSLLEDGSYVVYPQRHSSHMWMVEARVDEITEVDRGDKVLPALKVTPLKATWTHRLGSKPVTLTALDRVTVISAVRMDTDVPDGYCSVCHNFHSTNEESDCSPTTIH